MLPQYPEKRIAEMDFAFLLPLTAAVISGIAMYGVLRLVQELTPATVKNRARGAAGASRRR